MEPWWIMPFERREFEQWRISPLYSPVVFRSHSLSLQPETPQRKKIHPVSPGDTCRKSTIFRQPWFSWVFILCKGCYYTKSLSWVYMVLLGPASLALHAPKCPKRVVQWETLRRKEKRRGQRIFEWNNKTTSWNWVTEPRSNLTMDFVRWRNSCVFLGVSPSSHMRGWPLQTGDQQIRLQLPQYVCCSNLLITWLL